MAKSFEQLVCMCNKCKKLYFTFDDEETFPCENESCDGTVEYSGLEYWEYANITGISKSPDFLDAMIDLKKNDIIEYNLKLSQITEQNKAKRESDKPKCPTCQSTNIRKIGGGERGASILAFGIFSKKINKTFKCNKCGYTW